MKKFLIIWLGESISSIGSGMTAFALSIYVYKATGNVSSVSAIMMASFLPTILLSPLGGVLADRYDRRFLMIVGDFFSGLGIAYILWNIHTGTSSVIPIISGSIFSGIFAALLEPSFKATITDLLEKEDYGKASGMMQIAGNARYLISPALAGILLTLYNIKIILFLDICTFLITVIMISLIRKSILKSAKKEKENILFDLREGFKVLRSEKGIRSLIVFMSIICFFVGFLQTLLVPMILAIRDAKVLGNLESICAVGMLAGSIIIGVFGIKSRYACTLSMAGILASISMALSGLSANLYITGISIVCFFTLIPFINTSADVMVRNSVVNQIQGRVWGIISLISQTGFAFAYILSGILADYIFEPLLLKEGLLASTVGNIVGVGPGRGTGLMLIISGIGMAAITFAIGKNKNILTLEANCYARNA